MAAFLFIGRIYFSFEFSKLKLMQYFLLLFIFISTNIFAQYESRFDTRIETPFNSFTKLPSVEWAVRSNDTFVCLKPDISKILVDKILKSTILTCYPFEYDSQEELKIKYTSKDENMQFLFECALIHPIYDPNGNPTTILKKRKDEAEYIKELVLVHEKLYIIDGSLGSTVSYVSIIKDIITPQDIHLGKTEIIATAINKKYNFSPSQKDKIIYLTKTQKELYVDSIKKEDKYKETFGRNMVETLWPYVLANKLKAYSIATGKLLNVKEINSSLIGNTIVDIPVYDSEGNLLARKIKKYPLQANIFTKVIINQTWYYNDTKNIIYNKIPDIILYAKFNGEEELKPILKISFTK